MFLEGSFIIESFPDPSVLEGSFTNPNFMHYCEGNPSKLPYICPKFDPSQKTGFHLMTPLKVTDPE